MITKLVFFSQLMAAFRRWRNKYRRYKQQIPSQMRNRIILHYGLFKITWDWMILCLVFYTAVEVPFVSAFILTQVAQMNRVRKYWQQLLSRIFVMVFLWWSCGVKCTKDYLYRLILKSLFKSWNFTFIININHVCFKRFEALEVNYNQIFWNYQLIRDKR